MPRLLVAPPLRLFLHRGRADGVVDVPDRPTDTVGHVVQAAGVPLTEVGGLQAGDRRADPGERLTGDVRVLPRERPQPLAGPPRLLLDVHLGTLARRLRLLGLDTAWSPDADDDALVAQAQAQDRLLLTRDRGLLRRRALRRAAFVHGSDPDDQLDDVLDRFRLPLAPWTRCPACNGLPQPVDVRDVAHLLEPGTLRTQSSFTRCPGCGRVYWPGAHTRRLAAVVARATRSATSRAPGDRPMAQG